MSLYNLVLQNDNSVGLSNAPNVILPGRLLECFSYHLLDNEMFFCHLTTVSEGTLMFRRGVRRENSV